MADDDKIQENTRPSGPERARNVDRYVKGPEPTAEELAHHRDQAAAQDALPDPDPSAPERDPQAMILSDAVRRAHDQELSALANIALIRAGLFGGRGGGFLPGAPADRRDMDVRLQDLLDEPGQK